MVINMITAEEAAEKLGITAEELLADTETLTSILTYHVLAQEADSQLVATLDGESVATFNGADVMISVSDGSVMINDATVVSADLSADNGIVHVINAVLLPPDFEIAGDDMTDTTVEETADSIADIVGAAVGFSLLGVERIYSSSIPTGYGKINIAHGVCSIPAPATAELLKGIPLAPVDVDGELTGYQAADQAARRTAGRDHAEKPATLFL